MCTPSVHSGYRVDFGINFWDWFKIWLCVHVDFYDIVNLFFMSSQIGFGYWFG